jgi:hypothetical protein
VTQWLLLHGSDPNIRNFNGMCNVDTPVSSPSIIRQMIHSLSLSLSLSLCVVGVGVGGCNVSATWEGEDEAKVVDNLYCRCGEEARIKGAQQRLF